MKKVASEEKLELTISCILIVGVIASVAMEAIGILGYYNSNGNLNIIFRPEFALQGADFFTYSGNAFFQVMNGGWTPLQILSLGIIVLMMTPYVRVAASVIYFGLVRNPKYLIITLFVLIILTASLLVH
jgi:uncharacterized membrane protein